MVFDMSLHITSTFFPKRMADKCSKCPRRCVCDENLNMLFNKAKNADDVRSIYINRLIKCYSELKETAQTINYFVGSESSPLNNHGENDVWFDRKISEKKASHAKLCRKIELLCSEIIQEVEYISNNRMSFKNGEWVEKV